MKFNKLRLVGFKSFVEPTEFHIEPGLTGVVGPNGCGKSNLVEALRWVMGENSYKNMRASGMDDVIFSGSGNRPARNTAEVGLVLDNSGRTAPAAFNDSELIEVTRRIEREVGSQYRINAREVRARDVQLLFADASTGARSPALVRQGMIGEIISAKPQARRRILEEAAGVAGLHSRRHEAELRLKGAEENLTRLEDVMKQVDAQIDSLKRQARQASRYKSLASDIRRYEALSALSMHREASHGLADAERKLEADVREVAERTTQQAEAARLQAIAAHGLPALRDAEARAGAALQRIVLARETLEQEEKRAEERAAEIARRVVQIGRDLEREKALIEDANQSIARLEEEDRELAELNESESDLRAETAARAHAAEEKLAETEQKLAEAQALLADASARRAAAESSVRDETQRLARFEAEITRLETEFAMIAASGSGEDEAIALAEALENLLMEAQAAEERALGAEDAHAAAREAESALRGPLTEADRKAQRLETEVRTLSKLLDSNSGGLWPPVVEEMSVAKGYEAAIGAALGDDLDASTNTSAPAHWAATDASADPALPPGVQPLSQLVEAPPALTRRLAQIGVVLREEGPRLRGLLKPGQRLVSREGDLWRWDGFTQGAEAPTPAARRLAEKNRLGELTKEADVARREAEDLRAQAEQSALTLRAAAQAESDARAAHRAAQRTADETRERHMAAEKRRAASATRLSALQEAKAAALANRDEARQRQRQAEQLLDEIDEPASLAGELDHARAHAAQDRAAAAEARAEMQAMTREAEQRARRRASIASERRSWIERRESAADQIADFDARREEAEQEAQTLAEAPDEFLAKRRALMNEMETAESARKEASDARASAETGLADADRIARATIDAMSAAREEKARSESRVEAMRQRLADILRTIETELECGPDKLAELAGVSAGADLPDAQEVAEKLERLKSDRERLGAVNLRADDELAEIETQHERMVVERDDLTEAIRKLRGAIGNLNREGRERLLAAFNVVNNHFKELFTSLFGGGTAELQLVESDDPLEAGLEILARPPGKKPQTMTLLSGGEQALTAMSLIFAVFLTNPSPICVLDEVDAPLDDSNVERFCDLLEEMRKKTDTRFVTITHNPITMARMDRLFGVTMAERGVSQLVSVDLAQAERFLEAAE
ncbi:MAG: chromosome segregation protein SMC [Hyphomicrobiales bacterium]|nr:chromosome segregation protein SMC [Hyphomicrobiales bacterium]